MQMHYSRYYVYSFELKLYAKKNMNKLLEYTKNEQFPMSHNGFRSLMTIIYYFFIYFFFFKFAWGENICKRKKSKVSNRLVMNE